MGSRLKKVLKAAALQAQVEKVCHRLKIQLVGAKPDVWRRFHLTGDYSLADLHSIIQELLGWDNAHTHEFRVGKDRFQNPKHVAEAHPDIFDEALMIGLLKLHVGQTFEYAYGSEDPWKFAIQVEKVWPVASVDDWEFEHDGGGAAPPEDCGGLDAYKGLLVAYRNPKDEEHENAVEWLGDDFDPAVWADKEAFQNLEDEDAAELVTAAGRGTTAAGGSSSGKR
jgi:Plasmid pRiA4b ORF-3-like protein